MSVVTNSMTNRLLYCPSSNPLYVKEEEGEGQIDTGKSLALYPSPHNNCIFEIILHISTTSVSGERAFPEHNLCGY